MASKKKILIASIAFVFHAGLLVVLPLVLSYFIQQNNTMLEMMNLLKSTDNIDLSGIPISIAGAGAIITVASLIADLTEASSTANLVANIISSLLSLFIFLVLIGLGDIGSMGYMARTTIMEQASIGFVLDLRFFAIAMILVVTAGIAVGFAQYLISRREIAPQTGNQDANSGNESARLAQVCSTLTPILIGPESKLSEMEKKATPNPPKR